MSACDACLRRRPPGPLAATGSADASAVRAAAQAAGLETACPHDRRYPRSLLDLPDPPAALYLHGPDPPQDTAVAIVGSRQATRYGIEVAHALARDLSTCGIAVISGMAFGIDSAAHEGALAGGGVTVAVMPGGADVAYPRSRRGLHRRIWQRGTVVSEVPPGTAPVKWSFPARNRVMAALARMTLVVEGTERSGSLITARFAQDLGRDVGAVPGQVTSSLAAGPNALLADGACVVRTAQDVLDALYGPGVRTAAVDSAESLEPRLARLLQAVERGETVESITRTGHSVGEIMAGLTELELRGLIRRGGSGAYTRSA